ncbi:hypothetical protein O3M35_006593 [Rhynocoris fuscipes]|uniref:Uncharacterized protein n=1 Tax=Rhynocoris fuscipes TaxID=488301 RepID=A0AAW1DJB7_9HEMI
MENLKLFLLSLVPEIEILDELVKLEVAMFVTTHEITQDDFLKKLATFYEKLLIKNCTEYGDLIIPNIVSLMPYCLQNYFPQLAKILLFEHSSYQAQLMALKLLDTTINQDLPTYRSIIEHLLKCNHPIVKAAAVDILRNFSSNVHI